jgi:glutamate/tyrosine decarboxylase-like PLP-dependent enzyme
LKERADARRLGRRVLDLVLRETLVERDAPVWRGGSRPAVARRFAAPPPARGGGDAAVLRRLRRVLRDSMRLAHPRLFGLFTPAPLPVAALGDLAAAFLNQSPDAWKAGPAATEIVARLIRTFNDLAGFPAGAFGALTSGGGIANLIALKLARDRALGAAVRRNGVARAAALRLYASEEAHFSLGRGLDILGLGSKALVPIAVGRDRRLRLDRLEETLRRDRARGLRPLAIVATAGTTSTGALDPLDGIARLARRYTAFLHVDAAYGGALLVSRRERRRLRGIERADSITLDPHKWLFQPFSLAMLLVRDGKALRGSCGVDPGYLRKDLEAERDRIDFFQHSIEGSRPFRGLKLDLTLQAIGLEGLAERVERTLDVARHLEARLRHDPRFETCGAAVDLASVVLRYLPRRGMSRARLNDLQRRLQQAVERGGRAWFPAIWLGDTVWLRFGLFNDRTTTQDVDATLDLVARAGDRLSRLSGRRGSAAAGGRRSRSSRGRSRG